MVEGEEIGKKVRSLSKCTCEVTHGQGPLVPNSVTAPQLEGLKNWKAHSPQVQCHLTMNKGGGNVSGAHSVESQTMLAAIPKLLTIWSAEFVSMVELDSFINTKLCILLLPIYCY